MILLPSVAAAAAARARQCVPLFGALVVTWSVIPIMQHAFTGYPQSVNQSLLLKSARAGHAHADVERQRIDRVLLQRTRGGRAPYLYVR